MWFSGWKLRLLWLLKSTIVLLDASEVLQCHRRMQRLCGGADITSPISDSVGFSGKIAVGKGIHCQPTVPERPVEPYSR